MNEVDTFDTEEEAKQGFIAYKQDYIRKFAKKCKGKVFSHYDYFIKWQGRECLKGRSLLFFAKNNASERNRTSARGSGGHCSIH